MRKITLILSLLVAMVTTAVAAVGDVAELPNGVYVIKNNAETNRKAIYNGEYIAHTTDTDSAVETNFFIIRGTGDYADYYTIQTYNGLYVTYKINYKSNQDEALAFATEATDDNKWWRICIGNGSAYTIAPKDNANTGWNFCLKVGDDANAKMGFWDKATGNGKSHWILSKVSEIDGVYELKNQGTTGSRGYFVHTADYPGKIKVAESALTDYTSTEYCYQSRTAEGLNSYWYLVTSGKGNRYIFSLADGTFIAKDGSNAKLSDTPMAIKIGTSVKNSGYYQISPLNEDTYLSNSIGWKLSGDQVRFGGANDDAAPVEFVASDVAVDNTMLENVKNLIYVIENPVTITYNFKKEGVLVHSEQIEALLGFEYPTIELPCGVNATFPEGEVSESSTEMDIEITYSLPFEISTLTDGEFGDDVHWYRMTLNGSDLTSYVGATYSANVETVTLRNLYAFVGNPFAGYKIYNAQAGSGKVLWSSWVNDDGNPIPMTDVSSVTEGTDWLLNTNSDGYGFKRNGTDNAYVNYRNSTFSYWVSNSGATNEGSRITFTEYTGNITDLVNVYKTEAIATLSAFEVAGFDVTAASDAINALEITGISSVNSINEQLHSVLGDNEYTLRNGELDTTSPRYNKYLSAKPNSFNEAHGRHLSKDALWKFVLDGTVFNLYNEKNNVYLGTPNSNGDFLTAPTVYYTFSTDKNASVATGIELHTGNQTLHMNNHNSSGNRNNLFLSSFDDNDAASCWHIEEPVLSEEQLNALEELETVYDAKLTFKYCESGTSIGQYSSGDVDAVKKTFVDAETIFNNPTAGRTADEITAAKTAITDAIGTLVISMPTSGKYYRIKGACDATPANYYISGNTNGDGGRIACKANADATTVFYYNDNKLLVYNGRDNNNNIIDGLYFGLSSSNWKFSTVDGATPASTIEFAGSTRKAAAYTVKSGDVYVYYKVYGGQVEIDRYAENSHQNLDWTLEEVTSLPVTITAAEYATFHAPVEVTIPEDVAVTAHTVTINAITGNATLSEAIKVIPANTPVILNGDAGTYNLDITTTGAAAIEGNALSGTVAAEYATTDDTKDVFVLAKVDITDDEVDNPEVGLYLADRTSAFALKGHAAYLVLDKANPANNSVGFRFDFATTAVEKVEMRTEKEEIYDLQGRRINEITQPGIYVVGGKKVLVK